MAVVSDRRLGSSRSVARGRSSRLWRGFLTVRRSCSRVLLPLLAMALVALEPLTGAGQNPLRGKRLFVESNTPARKQAVEWARSRPQDAARMRRIADQPLAIWLGDWSPDIRTEVARTMARSGGAIPVFVVYNIPYRDCGQHSAGGARGGDAYRR
ncbi:MAG: glycoside hydrolase family 6 protein, partial [Gemmatimonadetes bacterium]|nr:glycoside hydrolase family 6 protein [Gemmatimonadota bacterium]